MSHIDDLISELCPQGVPIRPLGEVGTFVRGRRFTKADQVDEGLPSIHYGEIYTHYGVAATATISHVRPDLAPSLRFARPGDVIIAAVGETVEDVGKALAWLGTGEVAVHDDCFIFRSSLDPKYVVYFMQSDAFNRPKQAFVARAKMKRLSAHGLAQLRIPVPPLEVQCEIVRILDHFTELEAELAVKLEAEREGRRLQYAHYRDSLLTFAEGGRVRWAKLSDVATFRRGTAITAQETTNGDVPVVANGPVPIYFHSVSNRSGQTIVVARSGVNAGFVSFWDQPIFLTDAFSVHPDANLLMPKFVFHLLRAKQERLRSMKKGSGVPHVRVKDVEAYEIPIATLAEQERIVGVLDKFGSLLNDLNIELPAELTARRKQYEHYRDRLLTFKELAV